MKAYPLRARGETLTLTDLDQPEPAAGQVLVRVRATSVNPYDWHHVLGRPFVARVMPKGLGLRRARLRIPGCDLAGRVEAVGPEVTRFRPGDDVYALVEQGGFAQYAVVDEHRLAAKPVNLSYEQAAAVPMAALTALLAVRDDGRLRAGQRVLVNGASGGVGTFAVQLARAFGATVTGVCRGANAGLVRSLGADDVIDYTSTDFTRTGRRWDLIVDVAGTRSVLDARRALQPGGAVAVVGGPDGRWLQPAGHAFGSMLLGPLSGVRVALTDIVGHRNQGRLLADLTELIERDQLRPVIDRVAGFGDLPAAFAYQRAGHARGKVVVTV